MAEKTIKKYDAMVDRKNRVQIRGARYQFYHVEEFEDGTVLLKPRILVNPENVSVNTFHMVDKSMHGLKKNSMNKQVDIEKFIEGDKS